MASLELAGVETIDDPAVARSRARRWRKMAREVPEDKARELRQRAAAAEAWARRQENAIEQARREHDRVLASVSPIRRSSSARDAGATIHEQPGHARRAARAAGHKVYAAARPQAMRLAVNGRQHFFQGVKAPLGPADEGWNLFFEAVGVSLAIVAIADLLRAPGVIGTTSSHLLGAIQKLTAVRDPFTGATPAGASSSGGGSTRSSSGLAPATHGI